MKPNLLSVLKLHFAEKAFLIEEKQHHFDREKEGKSVGQWDGPHEQEFHSRIKEKRSRIFQSFIIVTSLVVLGAVSAELINYYLAIDLTTLKIVRAISIVIITWAVISKLEDIKTMGGSTYLELTSTYSFRRLYCIGVYLGTVSLFLVG